MAPPALTGTTPLYVQKNLFDMTFLLQKTHNIEKICEKTHVEKITFSLLEQLPQRYQKNIFKVIFQCCD
jgi:hypothetical protein